MSGRGSDEGLSFFVVDAFETGPGTGNPAGICLVGEGSGAATEVTDEICQRVAAEVNLSETAFVWAAQKGGVRRIRFFTPKNEVDLCGHATLAAGFVCLSLSSSLEENRIEFQTNAGVVGVEQAAGLWVLDFPRMNLRMVEPPAELSSLLSGSLTAYYRGREGVAVLSNADQVLTFTPAMDSIAAAEPFALCVTAAAGGRLAAEGYAFVYRFFSPNNGIPEDPVTGSACASLAPLWAERLRRDKLVAKQLSPRTGKLECRVSADRVTIAGRARLFLRGTIFPEPPSGKVALAGC